MSETSSEDLNNVGWVFYSEREEWKDVKPIPQEEGSQPIVAIAYSAKCTHSISPFYEQIEIIFSNFK